MILLGWLFELPYWVHSGEIYEKNSICFSNSVLWSPTSSCFPSEERHRARNEVKPAKMEITRIQKMSSFILNYSFYNFFLSRVQWCNFQLCHMTNKFLVAELKSLITKTSIKTLIIKTNFELGVAPFTRSISDII